MLKKANERPPATAKKTTRRQKKAPAFTDAEEQILRAATIHMIRKVGGLFVATGLREEPHEGSRRWIITITLRYPTGHEGYVGELLYDGKEFRLLTEESVVNERVRQIAADPERMRKWHEYRSSTLQAAEG